MIRYLLVRSTPDILEFVLVQDSGKVQGSREVQDSGETVKVIERLRADPFGCLKPNLESSFKPVVKPVAETSPEILAASPTGSHTAGSHTAGEEFVENAKAEKTTKNGHSFISWDETRNIISTWDYSFCAAIVSDPTSGNANIELPFSNRTKIDQVVPLQLQDLLPLDPDNYLCCNRLIHTTNDNLNIVHTSYIEEDVIANLLETLSDIGVNPRFITTDGAVLALLASTVWADKLQEPCIVFSALDETSYVAALIENGQCAELRQGRSKSAALVGDILLFATSIYTRRRLYIPHALAVNYESLEARMLALPEPSSEVIACTEQELKITDVAPGKVFDAPLWAHGLFILLTSTREVTSLVDFRVGPYSYRAMLHNFLTSIKGEATYLALAAIIGFGWVATLFYGVEHRINLVNEKVATGFKAVFPEEVIAQESEISYLDSRLTDVQSQLSDTGNISSLSPLESLKKLSASIDNQSDVTIEKMNLSYGSITFRGTALDVPTVGKLETTLSGIEGFCSAQVKPKGKTPGGTRYQFDAELTPCDIPVIK